MSDPYESFAWREAEPGVWQRDIDEVERFYTVMAKLYEGSGRVFFAITGHLSLTVRVTKGDAAEEAELRFAEALQAAWLRLRDEQPTIASQVVFDADHRKWRKTYRVLQNVAEEEAWLKESCRSVLTEQTCADWCNDDPPVPSLPTLFVITSPKSGAEGKKAGVEQSFRRDLVLRAHHDIIDGIGTLLLLDRLVSLTADIYTVTANGQPLHPKFDHSEVIRLSPPYRVAARIPRMPGLAQQQRFDNVAATTSAGDEAETIGIPYECGAVVPGRHQRVASELSTEETARVLGACKACGVTVTHAYHAAAAIALRDLQKRKSEPRRVQYVNYILRNERHHCAEPYNTDKCAAAVYHSVSGGRLVVEMTVPESKSAELRDEDGLAKKQEFRRILQEMKEYYCNVRDDREHYALAPHIFAKATPELAPDEEDGTRLSAIPPPRALPSVSISSMGRIDNIIPPNRGIFSVDDPWVVGEELTNGLGLFLGTYREHLCLSAAYNEAWHDKEPILGFLRRCQEIVFQGLEA